MIFLLILFGNPWIWQIGQFSPLLFLFLIISSFVLLLYHKQKVSSKIVVIVLIPLFYFQWHTTNFHSLILSDNDEQRVKAMRKQFYNPSTDVARRIFYRFHLADFFEGDLSVGLTRFQRNFFETLDPNIYFFSGHPRERVWANDFKKFPFILIVPFLIGLYKLIRWTNITLWIYISSSLVLLSVIGHFNQMGPFILFPFLVLAINSGIKTLWELKNR